MAIPGTKNAFRVSLKIAGNDWGTFQTKTGGKTSGNTGLSYPGAMADPVPLTGLPATDTITLTRRYNETDHDRMSQLVNGIGRYVCTVRQQPLDADGNANGAPITWSGILDGFLPPDVDSASADEAMLEIDIKPFNPVVV